MKWNEIQYNQPPINEYILIKNEDSGDGRYCPAIVSHSGTFILISCSNCKWSVPSDPYTHWRVFPKDKIKFCDGCDKNYIDHTCDNGLNPHSCKKSEPISEFEKESLDLKNAQFEYEKRRDRTFRLINIVLGFSVVCIYGIYKVADPLIKAEIEFQYKKRYVQLYKSEIKDEVKEISRIAIEGIKELKK